MKKIISVLAFLAVLGGANVFAKSLGFDSISKNLTAITGGGKASTGTIPEGRDILPALWQTTQQSDNEESSKILDSSIYLSGADLDSATYEISQYFLMKAMIGTTAQDSKVSIKVDGNKFTVETVLLKTSLTAETASTSKARQAQEHSLQKCLLRKSQRHSR